MPKHYVIAVKAVRSGEQRYEPGQVVSYHTLPHPARTKVDDLHKGIRNWNRREHFFAAIETETALDKDKRYPELAERWLQDQFDAQATYLMQGVLDPNFRGIGRPFTPESIAASLEDLGLTLEELRARYGEAAQRALDTEKARRLATAEREARALATSSVLTRQRSEAPHVFAAVRGVQAGMAFYAVQVTYEELLRLFTFDDDILPPQLRAQRILDQRRADSIGDYVVNNPESYILPALCASVSAEMQFEPVGDSGLLLNMGVLSIPAGTTLLINDGQHRRAGIEYALSKAPHLRSESVTVSFFYDQGLQRSQQIFADINGKHVKPASALSALYNHRCAFNRWVLTVLDAVPQVRERVDLERASVGAKSDKLWSLIAFRKFLTHLTGVSESNAGQLDSAELDGLKQFVARFFNECGIIPYWRSMLEGRISAAEVRATMVIGHAVFLEALGMYGACTLFAGEERGGYGDHDVVLPLLAHWDRLASLGKLDPAKGSDMWNGRCVVLGKMQKTADGVKTTAARLVALSGVPLPLSMNRLEEKLAA